MVYFFIKICKISRIKLMKAKCLRKHSRHEKTAVLLKLLSVVMNDAKPLTPQAHEQNSIFKCKQHTRTVHDPNYVKNNSCVASIGAQRLFLPNCSFKRSTMILIRKSA